MSSESLEGFQLACSVQDLQKSQKLCVEVDDRFVVLVKLGEEIYCLDDVCTHDGGPLGEGELDDHCLVCPRHGAKFDVRTGRAVTMPATESTAAHQVQVVGDRVFLRFTN